MSIGLMIGIIAGAIVLIVKRFMGEPVDARDTFLTPLILVGVGVYSVTKVDDLGGIDIVWLVVGGVVGIAFGAVRGTTTVLFARDGHLWQRYTVKTLVVWAVSAIAGFGITLLGHATGMHHDAKPITLSIGIGMLGEMLTLGLRALSTGVPFAPDKKSGSYGQRGESNSYLDRFLDNLGHPGTARETGDSGQPPRRDAPDQYLRKPTDAQHPRIDRSPTLRDGLDWLNQFRDRRA
ncbi:uncharacterized protein DUF1453 [Nocardia tenerifensis]|uniref:Uncharacterized protein DUF1453 n=1 Tax=Nocardia tenerifensis TaxID=228006 RepID=A0A318K224_9NOCA|nr:hypothetical protein [Nocardia tenerifensis]PXX65544.1 uncharacterized protein DUF1453 [Nocardia tenerifensis]